MARDGGDTVDEEAFHSGLESWLGVVLTQGV